LTLILTLSQQLKRTVMMMIKPKIFELRIHSLPSQ
jgi:hypothetical protein